MHKNGKENGYIEIRFPFHFHFPGRPVQIKNSLFEKKPPGGLRGAGISAILFSDLMPERLPGSFRSVFQPTSLKYGSRHPLTTLQPFEPVTRRAVTLFSALFAGNIDLDTINN